MKRLKSGLSLTLALIMILGGLFTFGTLNTSAATYSKIPALPISRVYQPYYDENGLCYWSSMATVQGYCLGSYTYKGVTTNYRKAGTDYNYLDRADAITKMFKDSANGYANDADNLTKYYPVKMTRVTSGIGKNAATYEKIYNQLAQGKPVIVYTGTHASVVIAYNGSTTTLQPSGFTVMEIKKDKTSSGSYWWVNSATHYNNHANSPMIDSASLSTNKKNYMCCYVNLESWISYCGNKLQEICYPTNAVNTDCTFAFNANGGTGTMSSFKASMGSAVTFPDCTFNFEGYTCEGYHAHRKSDNKWHVAGVGWRTLQEIRDGNLERSVYPEGLTFTMNTSWTKEGGIIGDTFTLHPVWKPTEVTHDFYANYSDTNYMAAIDSGTFNNYYQSRDTAVYDLSVENGDTLVITGKAAGKTGSDMLFKTNTNKSPCYNYCAGDNRPMTLTFRAKASVDGAKMYFRWGYTTDLQTITLTTSWQEYTIDMSKQTYDGAHMHPYLDKAGTFYFTDFELTDKDAPAPTMPDYLEITETRTYTPGKTYGKLPTPERIGYNFKGWYTQKWGGTRITETSIVPDAHTNLYAQWEAQSGILMGDADMDSTVTIKDATTIQKYLAGLEAISVSAELAANVVTEDDVNIKDATAIQKWLAGLDAGTDCINTYLSYM